MIRQLHPDDIDQHLQLTQAANAVEFTEAELAERRALTKPEQFWGYFVDGQLAARVGILPLSAYIGGVPFAAGGIAQVASYPEMRRQGMVGKLMIKSLEVMREAGQSVSLLNPFSYGFYRRYGWESFSTIQSVRLETPHFPRFGDASGIVKRLTETDWPVLQQVYDAYARRYNGMLLRRDESWWKHHVFKRKSGWIAVYFNSVGEPRGYLLYAVKDRHMRIYELIDLDLDARCGLWRFIANHDSMIDSLTFTAPSDDAFAFTLSEPTAEIHLRAHFMIRIVDVPAFLRQFPFARTGGPERLSVRIEDECAPWNSGCWVVELDGNGNCRAVTAVQAEPTEANPLPAGTVACDIQTFSAMMIGRHSPGQLLTIGKLSGNPEDVERWERCLPKQTPYIIDLF